MKLYETTFILNPELKDDGWEAAVSKYSGIINQAGAIKTVYRWGLRRLAYEIAKQSHGYYVHIIHESEGSVPLELERQFKLDESCMRFLTVLADNPKYLEAMEKGGGQAVTESESSEERRRDDRDDADEADDRRPSRRRDSFHAREDS